MNKPPESEIINLIKRIKTLKRRCNNRADLKRRANLVNRINILKERLDALVQTERKKEDFQARAREGADEVVLPQPEAYTPDKRFIS